MFRNDGQTARVCKTLLASTGQGGLWTILGPTAVALDLRKRDGGGLSSGQRIMLLVAFSLWERESGTLDVGEIFRLDSPSLELIGSLILAIAGGPDAVDEWIRDHARNAI